MDLNLDPIVVRDIAIASVAITCMTGICFIALLRAAFTR